jgi:hypothetical protein
VYVEGDPAIVAGNILEIVPHIHLVVVSLLLVSAYYGEG